MQDIQLENIRHEHLENLIENKVLESRSLEYKRTLIGNRTSEKKEFLADVSSFANTIGGDLIIGIESDPSSGEPTRIIGINKSDLDDEILKIENLIRTGINPRIWGLQIVPISISEIEAVIIIRIPNSWASPHRVDLEGHEKFYKRGSNGKYPMDVNELRIAFNLSDSIREKIKKFRLERANLISLNESFIPLPTGAKVILHLIPFSAFQIDANNNMPSVNSFKSEMFPMNSIGGNYQYNIEGYMCYSNDGAYTQVYRNGILEVVDSSLLQHHSGEKSIPSALLERVVLMSFERYRKILIAQNIAAPIFVALSLTDINEYKFAVGHVSPIIGRKHPHGMANLFLPEFLMQEMLEERKVILRPIFDVLWNAYGYAKSPNFNEEGNWQPS